MLYMDTAEGSTYHTACQFLRRFSWFLPSSLLLLYLKSYILPWVDYCDVVWDCCSRQDANRLQTLFNYACGIALHCPCLSSSSTLWNDLGLSSLSTSRKLHLAQLMFKCHNSLAPPYLSSIFHKPSHRYSTHNSNLVNLPPVKSSFGQRSLSFLVCPFGAPFPSPSVTQTHL